MPRQQTMRATVNPAANTRVVWDDAGGEASVQRYSGNPAIWARERGPP